jgi:hypothetical protein
MDMAQALELAQLIADIEPKRREDGEFFLVYRKDTPLWIEKEFAKIAAKKFQRSRACQARNHETGWPAGPNMLAGSAFMEMSLLKRAGICQNEAFLLFEPDCVPMQKNWLDQLSAEWERVKGLGKEAFGHWHDLPDNGLHMNGNAVWKTSFYDDHPQWIIGSGCQGWDYFFREQFLPISMDSNLIFQHWNRHGISMQEFEGMTKNGVTPAWFHGVKTPDARQHARKLLT